MNPRATILKLLHKHRPGRWWSVLPLLLILAAGCAAAPDTVQQAVTERPELKTFIEEMVVRHGFEATELTALFSKAEMRPSIIRAISKPAESKPWHEYRKIFLTAGRIDGGVAYWNTNEEILREVRLRYGVDPRVLVAIIGVETRYGRHAGRYPVIDALSTLAFGYPPRSEFFRNELEQFLLLTREEGIDPLGVTGSYAGAMGDGQFIPSSYRRFAVDFDNDGRRDIWKNPRDVIGSVANYLHVHGWEPGQPVAMPVTVHGDRYQTLLGQGLKPHIRVNKMRQYGVEPRTPVAGERLAMLIDLEQRNGHDYWLGLNNFYVITRYNHSALYAMAVYQLAEEIAAARQAVNDL